MAKKPKVCIIGAEGWGSAISTAVCKNVVKSEFDEKVHIYVYDELVRSNYLSEVINERHENIKYLPGIKLESNLVAVNDLIEAAKEADILIFATSHSFIKPYCNILAGKVKSSAYAISLIKGLDHIKDGEIDLYSHAISKQLNIPCYSMMSANSAMEMAQGKLTEITIGCNDANHAHQLSNLFQTDNCKVFSIDDVDGVELCNTLKDLVALSAGFIDGLRLGENARVACLHLGLKEMMRFIKTFNPNTKLSTFFESCGLANSVASSYADKNVTFAKCFVTSRKTVQEIEANLLNGRKLLGPIIAGEIFAFLEKTKMQDKYPLFTVLHRICQNEVPPDAIVDILRKHPDLSNSMTQMQKDEYKMPVSFGHSVLKNLVDVAPDATNTICKQPVDNSFDSNTSRGKEQRAFRHIEIANSNFQKSGVEGTAALDAATPNKADVEFTFEIASADEKPEIYLTLREVTNPPGAVYEHHRNPWLNQNEDVDFSLSNAVGISHSPNVGNGAEYVSMKEHPAEISQSGASKWDGEKSTVGLTNFIKRHVNPLNDKYKALKVRAKLNDGDSVSKLKMESLKSTSSEKENPSKKMKVKKADSKSRSTDKTEAKQKHEETMTAKQNSDEKTQVLYDEDPSYTKRVFAEEPSVSKLFDIMRIKENRAYEEDVIGHSLKANERAKRKNKKVGKRNKVNNEASDNVLLSKESGYKVDYMRTIRPTEKHESNKKIHNDAKMASIHKADNVPVQYPKTDNSYRPTISDLEAQNNSRTEYQQKDYELSMPTSQQNEDETNVRMASESSKMSRKSFNYDERENVELFEEKPNLKYGGKEVESIYHAFEDPTKLLRAQEYLDEQSQLIKNLLLEVAASDSFNKDFKYKHNEDQLPNNKTNELNLTSSSRVEEQTIPSLNKDQPHQTFNFSSKHEMKESELRYDEPKALESGLKDFSTNQKNRLQINEQSTEFDKMQAREFLDYLKQEEDNINNDFNMVYEDDRDVQDDEKKKSSLLDKKAMLLKNQFRDEKDNEIIQEKYEMILEKQFPVTTEKGGSKAYETGLNDFDNHSVEEGVEGNSKTFEDHRSSAFIKKNQMHGLEDPNLRFYHGKNDGDQGPEWNWLFENVKHDENFEKTQKSIKQAENRGLGLELDDGPSAQSYQDQPTSDNKLETHKSSNQMENSDVSLHQNSKDNSTEYSQSSLEQYLALHQPQPISEEDANFNSEPLEMDEKRPIKFESKQDDIFMEEVNPISQSLIDERFQESLETNPIHNKHTTNEDAEVMQDEAGINAIENDPTASGLNEKEYEVMNQAVNDFKKILHDVEAKFHNSDAFENDMKQQIDNKHNETICQDEEKYELNTESGDSEFNKALTNLMSKGQSKEREVDYSGNDPYLTDFEILPEPSTLSNKSEEQGEKMRKKIVVRPSFHPPINPRVRIPRPPFDVRDHEYHTVNYRPPPNLLRNASLPLRKIPVVYRSKQAAASNVVKLPRPVMRLPSSVMRSSVLAVELGIFAAFFSRYRGSYK